MRAGRSRRLSLTFLKYGDPGPYYSARNGAASEVAMLYPTNEDLPASVRRHLPAHAQDTYREALNLALGVHPGEEEWAHRIAWSAVKRSYIKVGDSWIICLAQ